MMSALPVLWAGKYPETASSDDTLALPPPARPVQDPYQWLEGDVRVDSRVAEWVKTQHDLGESFLEQLSPYRETFGKEIAECLNTMRTVPSALRGTRWFLTRNEGLQDFPVYYYTDTLQPEDFVKVTDPSSEPGLVKLLDANELSEDKSVSISDVAYSRDGDLVAYTTSTNGSDWLTVHFLKFTGQRFEEMADEQVPWVRYMAPVLKADNSGYYLTVFDPPENPEMAHQERAKNPRLLEKTFATGVVREIWRDDEHATSVIYPMLDHSARWLVIHQRISSGARSRVLLRDNWNPEKGVLTMYDKFDATRELIGVRGNRAYVITDSNGAKRQRIVYREINDGAFSEEKELVPEHAEDMLNDATLLRDGTLALFYTHNCVQRVQLHSAMSGRKLADLKTPGGIGTVDLHSDITDGCVVYTFTSFAERQTVYRFNVWSHEHEVLFKVNTGGEHVEVVTEQIFAKSGAPAFVVRGKDVALDGSAPTILYGYGGFRIPLLPTFVSYVPTWLRRGGMFVYANLRGGAEFGEEWHEQGMRHNKQNSFDDFHSIAEYLIEHNYTSSSHLGILGGSNGGLLVGAAITQRPDLYGAAVPRVGVLDMLRYHKFTGGVFWIEEYGNPEDSADFEYLVKYSPYHKALADGPKNYPPTLVVTADTDDRVVPMHSFKFLAALQRMQKNRDAPVIARLEMKAGHGAGLALNKAIAASADILSFFAHFLR